MPSIIQVTERTKHSPGGKDREGESEKASLEEVTFKVRWEEWETSQFIVEKNVQQAK